MSLDSNGTATDATSYATASITPTANRLVIAVGHSSRQTASATTPTLSGCGITWTQIATVPFQTIASPLNRLTAFWGWAESPSTGALTFDFGGVTQNGFSWAVFEVPLCDLTFNDTPFFQIVTNSSDTTGTTASATLAAVSTYGGSYSGLIAITAIPDNPTITPRTNWTELHDVGATTPTKRLHTQYRIMSLGVDDDASATWTGNLRWAMIAFELRAQPANYNRIVVRGNDGYIVISLTEDVATGDIESVSILNNDSIITIRVDVLDQGSAVASFEVDPLDDLFDEDLTSYGLTVDTCGLAALQA